MTQPKVSLPHYQCDGQNHLWYYPSALMGTDYCSADGFPVSLFDPAFLEQQQMLTGQASGRGTSWFFRHENQPLVLRHYYRGGLPGKLLNDQYLWLGQQACRCVRELKILTAMRACSLPVPEPVAAQAERKGLIYRADIIIKRLDNSRDLAAILAEYALGNSQWQKIGKTLADFHQAGVFHADLNLRNILMDDEQKIWLIDFDRACFRRGDSWKQKNLSRLLRSLHKEKYKNPDLYWSEKDFEQLCQGYGVTNS